PPPRHYPLSLHDALPISLEHMPPGSPESNALIAALVSHHVAVTSTLVSIASGLPDIGMQTDGRPAPDGLVDAMSPDMREGFEYRSEEHTSELQSPYDLVC